MSLQIKANFNPPARASTCQRVFMRSALCATKKLLISFLLTYIVSVTNKSFSTSRKNQPASAVR